MKIELCHTRGERENPAGLLPAYAHLGEAQVSSLDVGKDRVIHSRALTPYDYWRLVGLDHGRVTQSVTKTDIQHIKDIIDVVDYYLPIKDEFLSVWGSETIDEGLEKLTCQTW